MTRQFLKKREQSQSVESRQKGQMFTPFSSMRRFADEMDRIFQGFGFPTMEGSRLWDMTATSFSPEIDVVERDGKLVLRADLPGLTKDDVTVEISEGSILIEGERKYEHEE